MLHSPHSSLSNLYLSNRSKKLLSECFQSLLRWDNPSSVHCSLRFLRDKLLGNPILRRSLSSSPLLECLHNSLLNCCNDPLSLQYCCSIITSLAKDPLLFVPLMESKIPSLLLQRLSDCGGGSGDCDISGISSNNDCGGSGSSNNSNNSNNNNNNNESSRKESLIHLLRSLRSIFIHVPTIKEFKLEPPLTTNLLSSFVHLHKSDGVSDTADDDDETALMISEYIYVILAGFLPLQCDDGLPVAKYFVECSAMMERSFALLLKQPAANTELTVAVLDFLAGLSTSPSSKTSFIPMIIGLGLGGLGGHPLLRVKDSLFSMLGKFDGGEGVIFASVILIHILSFSGCDANGIDNGIDNGSGSSGIISNNNKTTADVRMISIWLPMIIKVINSTDLSLCGRAAALLGIACNSSSSSISSTTNTTNPIMEELQMKAINNEDLLKRLIGLISTNSSPSLPALKGREVALEGCLLCIASLSSQKEEHRRVVMEFGNRTSNASSDGDNDNNNGDGEVVTRTRNPLLKSLVQCLSYHNTYGDEDSFVIVRAAACQCVRSLSRSVKALRTGLVDAGVVDSLLSLVSSSASSSLLKRTACAALCNLVLDFSPMKEKVLKLGGVKVLVALVDKALEDGELAFNALWALKNLLYLADSKIKMASLSLIGKDRIEGILLKQDLCSSPKWTLGCQEQCLNLLRNLICEKESDITEVINVFGRENLLSLLEGRVRNPGSGEALQHSLYIIANACTNNSGDGGQDDGLSFKNLVMGSNLILPAILQLLNAFNGGGNSIIPWTGTPLVDLQLASLWCLINLSWPSPPSPPPATSSTNQQQQQQEQQQQQRIASLKAMGFEDCLQNLMISISDEISLGSASTYNPQQLSDLRDRVQTCVRNFSHFTSTTVLASTSDLQNMMMVDANSTSSLE